MSREAPSSATGGPTAVQGTRPRSVGWQLLQVAALAAMLLAGMYEVDLDARALAEKRARTALRLAVESVAVGDPSASTDPGLEQAMEAYAKACAECASPARCEETIRSIRVERRVPAGRGPCRVGFFERWHSDETAGTSSPSGPGRF